MHGTGGGKHPAASAVWLDDTHRNRDKERMKINGLVRDALEATGLPYELRMGSRHIKIVVDGRLVGILPTKDTGDRRSRAIKNTIAQIRRTEKGNKE